MSDPQERFFADPDDFVFPWKNQTDDEDAPTPEHAKPASPPKPSEDGK